jgi:hypothetical protein
MLSLQEFEMRDAASEFFEPKWALGNLGAKQILMVAVEQFPLQTFVSSDSNGYLALLHAGHSGLFPEWSRCAIGRFQRPDQRTVP